MSLAKVLAILPFLEGRDAPEFKMAHDLFVVLMEKLGVTLTKVVVVSYDTVQDLFHAILHLDRNGEEMTIDWGPTDAIAIALQTKSPIYAESELLEKEGSEIPPLSLVENPMNWSNVPSDRSKMS